MVAKVHGMVQGAERQATELDVSSGSSAEPDPVAAVPAGDDEFSDVPTESNRANPLSAPSDPGKETAQEKGQGLAGAGSYRLVRPATSDRIDVHPTPSPDRPTPHRVVIGVARK
jgi:hypothetical protein